MVDTLSASGRYAITPVRSDDVLATWVRPEVPLTAQDSYHTITQAEEGRLDTIALRFYGSITYAWAIAVASGLAHPVKDAVEGTVLRLPAASTLRDLQRG
jgi:hypothetical protein